MQGIIKLGSVLGSILSAITIDSLTKILDKCENIWDVEGTKIKPLLFKMILLLLIEKRQTENSKYN